jgi:hypothetical protein
MRLSERHEATDETQKHQAERSIVTTPTKLAIPKTIEAMLRPFRG